MKNYQHWWIGIISTVGCVFLLIGWHPVRGNAATLNPNFVDINFVSDNGNPIGAMVPNGIATYPKVVKVAANNTIDGQITNKTTQFRITLDGSLALSASDQVMNAAYFDLMADENPDTINLIEPEPDYVGQSLRATPFDPKTNDNLLINQENGVNRIDFGRTQKVVNVSVDPQQYGSVAVGVRFFIKEQDQYKSYAIEVGHVKPEVTNPELPSTISATESQISGKGKPGYGIEATINGQLVMTQVQPSGDFTLRWKQPIGNQNSEITVIQKSPDVYGTHTGAHGQTTVRVQPVLPTISPATANVQFTNADLTALEGQSNQDIVNWLANRAQLQASVIGGTALKLIANPNDVLQQLKAAKINGPATFKITAQDVNGNASQPATVTATYVGGELAFGKVPASVDFGSCELPMYQAKQLALTGSSELTVADTRPGSNEWQLMATLSKSTVNGQPFKGQLLFGDLTLSEKETLITDSQRSNGTIGLAGDKGLRLNVQPQNVAGQYEGIINWTLSDVPS
ncbi:hypothetical protein [Lactiplantibacillus plajomi]|uniref:Cell surface protein n=1 Tax=Lactiplantibacillus plajomi TaxID=1457217 RepID=A0ABV6K3Z6_9LACO|nr:hypothetical protein [Lactiplantibacillus plajomi]